MQVKYWTNFNKRKNSTKQPSGGTEISVSLKNPCSVENPQIEVVGVPDSANYFYIADFGRYYFRSDAIKVTKDITQFNLEVDTMAGAFHLEKLSTGVEAKIIKDFGATTSKAYAILMDNRAVRLHVDYEAVRENFNGAGDFLNLFSHMELTGFISRNAFFTIFVDD